MLLTVVQYIGCELFRCVPAIAGKRIIVLFVVAPLNCNILEHSAKATHFLAYVCTNKLDTMWMSYSLYYCFRNFDLA
jgi:hypothetical protein